MTAHDTSDVDATWADWTAVIGPDAMAAAVALGESAPPLTARQHAEVSVLLRRHLNPAADAA